MAQSHVIQVMMFLYVLEKNKVTSQNFNNAAFSEGQVIYDEAQDGDVDYGRD